MSYYKNILGFIDEQEKWRKGCLNMIASENVTSKAVEKGLNSDFAHRYAEGLLGGEVDGKQMFERFYQGTRVFDHVEGLAMKLSKELFSGEHANVVPLSGTIANLTVYKAVAKYGDKVSGLSIPAGGHISHTHVSAAGVMGLKEVAYVFDKEEMNIDVDATRKMLLIEKPKIMIFGASLFLFPHPLKELRETADEIGAVMMYDGAHVLGLIAGGKFQNPLKEGADVLTGSTHKTFPGPQKGIVVCKNTLRKKIDNAAFPGLTSNHHLHNVAGLAIACCEMKEFGKDYAVQIVKNAKALGAAMAEEGFNVICENKGYTESHQVVADVKENGGGSRVAEDFEKANIIINKNLLPWDSLDQTSNPSGIRIGVQEMTRFGMKESDMKEIAHFMKRIAINKHKPEEVKEDVEDLRKQFQEIHYTYKN
jgi:glycine hydroxymethyltransferase